MSVAERSRRVAGLFDRNAERYDLVNTVICFGQDAGWRRWAAREAMIAASSFASAASPPGAGADAPRVLDAFGGTGLVALELARLGGRVTLADISASMLEIAARRARKAGVGLEVAQSDLAATPAASILGAPFAAVTLSFGLRYVDDKAGLLRGLAAALAPGGSLVVLEAVVAAGRPLSGLARRYYFDVAPRIGALIAGCAELYDELSYTTAALGSEADLLACVRDAGLEPFVRRTFAQGVVVGVVARPASR